MQTQNATPPRAGMSLVAKFADKFNIEPDKLMTVLKKTCFRQKQGEPEVTNEQMAALLVVADQYGLNPFTREIYAFPDKGSIVPVVGVDGWARIINEHPSLDGLEFRESDEAIKIDDKDDAKPCPIWMEVVIYRKDRSRPTVIREYLDECYKPQGKYDNGNMKKPGPWQTHTKRFLRHKTLIQGARIAFGFAGVYDEDEAERIHAARVIDMTSGMPAAIDVDAVVDTSAFDAMAADLANDPQFQAFLEETAKTSEMSIDALKVEAAKDFEKFVAVFRSWAPPALGAAPITLTMPTQQAPEKEKNQARRKGADARVAAAQASLGDDPRQDAPVDIELQAKRADVKAALEDWNVVDIVDKLMDDKGHGPASSWTIEQCEEALRIGSEEAQKLANEA